MPPRLAESLQSLAKVAFSRLPALGRSLRSFCLTCVTFQGSPDHMSRKGEGRESNFLISLYFTGKKTEDPRGRRLEHGRSDVTGEVAGLSLWCSEQVFTVHSPGSRHHILEAFTCQHLPRIRAVSGSERAGH